MDVFNINADLEIMKKMKTAKWDQIQNKSQEFSHVPCLHTATLIFQPVLNK